MITGINVHDRLEFMFTIKRNPQYRDYLRAHPDVKRAYEAEKRRARDPASA